MPIALRIFLASLMLAPAGAAAHAFAERYDLPLPLAFYLAGAGAAVLVSFMLAVRFLQSDAASLLAWRHPLPSLRITAPLRAAVRSASVAVFLLCLGAGLFGPQGEPLDNLLPVMVWILWWVGLTYVCALLGNIWPLLDPIRILAEGFSALTARRRAPFALSESAGIWPAVLLFFLFIWMEMVWPSNAVPHKLALAILIYCAVNWAAMAVFGIETWLARGEAFNQFFALVARASPIDSERRALRCWGAGLAREAPASPSQMAFVLLALASVSFDGLRETPFWAAFSAGAMDFLYRAGILAILGNVVAGALVKTFGLLAAPFFFAAVYLAVCRCCVAMAGKAAPSTSAFARQHVWSLLPIAIAYHLAHYLSYLLIQGQAIIPLASDPLGLGWNLFGTRGREIDIAIVDAGFIWYACVAAIVAGHIVAVVASHAAARRMFADAGLAVRAQIPLLALMVGYTIFSLWVLSQPIVES